MTDIPELLPPHLLILGGTTEAADLGRRVAEGEAGSIRLTMALAGRTSARLPQPGSVHIGGFGGADGLAAYIGCEKINLVIDATHPFAAQISASAAEACQTTQTPLLRLHRPPWQPQANDRWIDAADASAAAALLPGLGRRIWLTTGASTLVAFAALDTCAFLIRLIEPPRTPLPFCHATVIFGRGPFTLENERRMIAEHRLEVLVTKASGGAATEAKLIAAREARIPVVMLRRPQPSFNSMPHPVETADAALDWLKATLSEQSGHLQNCE